MYRETLDLFTCAEELGFDTAWVRSYKFRRTSGTPGFSFPGGLPSPFPFLGAVAGRTSRIRLGTAVVPLPLENVVRVAEDAAVLDVISDGRLELGVSNGGRPPIAVALGIDLDTDPDRKKASYLRSLGALTTILDGNPINGTDQELNPPAPGLSARIWESALTEQTGHDSALRGDGVLIGTTQTVPAEVTAAPTTRACRTACRPGSASLFTSTPPRTAGPVSPRSRQTWRRCTPGARTGSPRRGRWPKKAEVINVHYGTPEQITESIRAFPAFGLTSELQFSVAYGTASYAQRLAAIEAVAAEIAPALGWQPDHVSSPGPRDTLPVA